MIYLSNKEPGINQAFNSIIYDSCLTKDGRFSFKGNYKPTDFFALEIPSLTTAWLPFVPSKERDKIIIEGDVDSLHLAKVGGSSQHSYFLSFKDSMRTKFDYKSIELYERQHVIPGWKDSLSKIKTHKSNYLIESSLRHPDKFAIVYFAYVNFIVLEEAVLEKIYNNLSNSNKQTGYGNMLFNNINSVKVGDQAYSFSIPDTSGNQIALENYRGRYILLDFWASWCAPCLKELIELKSIYDSVDNKKVEFIGVSFDTKGYLWKKSIKENAIPWLNISDLKGNKSPMIDRYKAISLPHKILINPDGMVIFSSNKLEEVKYKLKEVGLM